MFVISLCVFCWYYIHIDIGSGIELAEITSMNHLYVLRCIDVQLYTNVSGLSLDEDIDMSWTGRHNAIWRQRVTMFIEWNYTITKASKLVFWASATSKFVHSLQFCTSKEFCEALCSVPKQYVPLDHSNYSYKTTPSLHTWQVIPT